MFYSVNSNRRKRWYRFLCIGRGKLVALGAVLVGIAVLFLGGLVFYTVRAMQYDMDAVVSEPGGSMLFDAERRPIALLSGTLHRPLTREELPRDLVNAFVAREDEQFFTHNGVVLSGVLRSLFRNVSSLSYKQGASTITMQLTRHVYELRAKTLDRKLLEAMLAQRIEHHYDKYTILLQYLSRIYFGQSCDGIRAAARCYFDKEVSQLDLGECATLAGLVRGPSIFNPRRSMKAAVQVRNETLERMEECGFITPEQCEAAKAEEIVLRSPSGDEVGGVSYAALWAQDELEEIAERLGEKTMGGVNIVTTLNLPVQQMLEQAVERALSAVEQPSLYPEEWNALYAGEEAAAEARKSFMRLRRPAGMKVRGEANDVAGLLQACVVVVDTRRRRVGQVLALVSGRSATDGRNRWLERSCPGRNAAPLLFACACMPGSGDHHIVARDMVATGRALGYDPVHAFYTALQAEGCELPDREHEDDLYAGNFPMRRLDLARFLFSLQNHGRDYRLSLVQSLWGRNGAALYATDGQTPPEFIRRESADAASTLPPFVCAEGEPVVLSEPMADGAGHWVMLSKPKGVCVFVWMGVDDSAAAAPELRPLLARASLLLAREVFNTARALLRAQQENSKETPQAS